MPLIITGPGIPQGRRVPELVGLQQIFETVLDLTGGIDFFGEGNSLRCSWAFAANSCNPDPMIVSELDSGRGTGVSHAAISAITPRWHLIRNATEDIQLYDLTADPEEEVNLAHAPEHQGEVETLERRLFDQFARRAAVLHSIETHRRAWLAPSSNATCPVGKLAGALVDREGS